MYRSEAPTPRACASMWTLWVVWNLGKRSDCRVILGAFCFPIFIKWNDEFHCAGFCNLGPHFIRAQTVKMQWRALWIRIEEANQSVMICLIFGGSLNPRLQPSANWQAPPPRQRGSCLEWGSQVGGRWPSKHTSPMDNVRPMDNVLDSATPPLRQPGTAHSKRPEVCF